MSEMSYIHAPGESAAPARAIADLRAIQALVDELAGAPPRRASTATDLDQRYGRAPEVARMRFDAIAGETAAFAAAGLSAIIAGRAVNDRPTGGAAHLAREMERAIGRLERLLG